ncbi:MAG: hypothetical protein NNA20_05080 [Nitrospira sp.]|nr:hypothetical protein [Nitrospira sp.]MCP9441947.1 hypothetical protein [Nitrospira sp.]
MQHTIKTGEDLRWLIVHTGGFRSGYVTDVQMSKRRLFDEESGRDIPAGTTVSVTIRYQAHGSIRVAKLTMTGVTDFSLLEQEGADCSSLDVIQAEYSAGRLRFWFDPQGELYIVCDEAHFQEVSAPIVSSHLFADLARWTFQGHTADGPTVQWLLDQLDKAGLPCVWTSTTRDGAAHPTVTWEGDLTPADRPTGHNTNAVRVMMYKPLAGDGFGLMLRILGSQDRQVCRIVEILACRITRNFEGTCLVGTTIIPNHEWETWMTRNSRARSI